MTLYCGIDLHADNKVISVIDDHDVMHDEKRHPNDLQIIRRVLEPFQDELLACVVESTYNWMRHQWVRSPFPLILPPDPVFPLDALFRLTR
jgi:transposase